MPLQIKGHFDWRQAARGQAIPTSELQRVDEMAMQGFDENGGFAGDNIANPGNAGELTPGTLQCIWVKITFLDPVLSPPTYSGEEVTGSRDGAGVYTLRHHESSITLINCLYEVNDVFDDLLTGQVVLAWPSNDVTPTGVTIWRFMAPGSVAVTAGEDAVDFILVTGPAVDGIYPGIRQTYDTSDDDWTSHEVVRCKGANSQPLVDTHRYIGKRADEETTGDPSFPMWALEDDSLNQTGGDIIWQDIDIIWQDVTININNVVIIIEENQYWYIEGPGFFVINAPLKIRNRMWVDYGSLPLPEVFMHDVELPAKVIIRTILTMGNTNVTGFVHTADGGTGQLIKIENSSDEFTLTLWHDNALSTAQNRILCPGNTNFDIPPNGGVWLWYDVLSQRWRVNSTMPGGSAYTPPSPPVVPVSLIYGSDVFLTSFTPSSGTWTDVPATLVNLPSEGVYQLAYNAECIVAGESTPIPPGPGRGTNVRCRLFDATSGSEINATTQTGCHVQYSHAGAVGTAAAIVHYTVDGPKEIRLQALVNPGLYPAAGSITNASLTFLKLDSVDTGDGDGFDDDLGEP